jgi:hypothetical protein
MSGIADGLRTAVRVAQRTGRQTSRRLKFMKAASRRIKSVQKTLFFNLRDSPTGRMLLKGIESVRAPKELRSRRHAGEEYLARVRSGIGDQGSGIGDQGSGIGRFIDPAAGYGLISPESVGDLSQLMVTCRRLFEIKKAGIDADLSGFDSWTPERRAKYLSGKRSFLRYLLNDEDLRRNPELVDFALSDAMMGAATRYLGMVPFLTRVDLMYSLPREATDNIESQLFHLDHEGLTQLKLFVNVYDVGDAEGPFTFIPADTTSRIVRDVRQLRRRNGSSGDVEARRYSDAEITAVSGGDAIVALKGPAGTGVAIDTSRCLHLGSRVQPGSFRLCLYLQYCTTREITNVFDLKRYKSDPVRYLAVKHSAEPGRQRAADYTSRMMG